MSINIYVGNLSYDVSDSALNDLFAQFGEVKEVKIISDTYSGRPRGFAFVEMLERSDGEHAIKELNGKELQGRSLKVSEARPRRDRKSYGGGQPRRSRDSRPRGGGPRSTF